MGEGEGGATQLPVSIKALEEEEVLLSQLTEIERGHIGENVSSLKQLIKQLDTPIHVDPSTFVSEVVINPAGQVMLLSNGAPVIPPISLERLPGPAIISILIQAVPEIKRLLVEKKTTTADRASVLEKTAKEFRSVAAAIPKPKSE
jgi:hypothetical protein